MAGFVDYLRMGMGWWSAITGQAPLSLALVDNADGTGLVATVAGSSSGSSNQLICARHYDGVLSAQFTVLGTRTGDGNIAGSLAVGDYWLYLVSTTGSTVEMTPMRAFRVTDAATADAIHFRVLEAVVSRLQTLSLPGIDPANIQWRKIPWNRSANPMEGIFVTPSKESGEGGTNLTDNNIYPVQVTIIKKSNDDLTANLNTELSWRQQCIASFNVTPYAHAGAILLAVPECYELEIDPGPIIDVGSYFAGYDIQAFTLRPICVKTRGL